MWTHIHIQGHNVHFQEFIVCLSPSPQDATEEGGNTLQEFHEQEGTLCRWIYEVYIIILIGDIIADFGNKWLLIFYGGGGIVKTSVTNIIASVAYNSIVSILRRFMDRGCNSAGNSLINEVKDD